MVLTTVYGYNCSAVGIAVVLVGIAVVLVGNNSTI